MDGYIEQKLFQGGQVVKAGERLYLLDQRTFSAEVQKAKAAVAKAEADPQYAKEGVEVLRAELLSTEWGRRAVLVTVLAEVVTAYFTLRDLDSELAIAQRTLVSRQKSLR